MLTFQLLRGPLEARHGAADDGDGIDSNVMTPL
jgi:hypothetical protein